MKLVMQDGSRKKSSPWVDLEAKAQAAHEQGEAWESFWQRVGAEVANAEPFDNGRYRRLHTRLWMIVHHGGNEPKTGDGQPWWVDEAKAKVTQAEERRQTATDREREAEP